MANNSTGKRTGKDTGTLGKILSLLDIITQSAKPLRFSELLLYSAQPKGTLHRQLMHLLEEGLVEQNQDGSYELGIRLLQFSANSWSKNSLRNAVEPLLCDLQRKTGETVHLGVLQGNQVIYLDKVESQQSVRMYSQIGNASPIYCTGVGKAILAALSNEAITQLMANITFQRYTSNTLTSAEALWQEITLIRQQHFAEDNEEHEAGIRCIAAPVFGHDGKVVCGISATAPVFRLQNDQLQQWQVWVVESAQLISERIAIALGPRHS